MTCALFRRAARLVATLIVLVGAGHASAQTPGAAVDPTVRPALGADPVFRAPTVERFTLSNGLPVLFVAKPGVPLAQIDLLVRSGATSDPDGLGGLATFTADAMDEGAGTLSALDLADAVDFLGVALTSQAGLESMAVRLHAPVSKLDEALPLMADVALRPTFAEAEIERLRASRLTALAQRRDEARSLASVAYDRALYGDASPYGRSTAGTPASTRAMTRDAVVRFHDAVVRPSNAALVVVGALDRAAITPTLERLFGATAWPDRPAPPRATIPVPTQVARRTVVLVDKPGAAQTVVRIGRIGAARATPDYYALQVLNAILGGSFTSRLNQNLRETHGYTYGAGSRFDFRSAPGPFTASADVQTDVTGPALTEFFNELRGILQPVPAAELSKATNYVALSFPEPFETTAGTAAMVGALFLDDLPLDTYAGYTAGIRAVTGADLARVARQAIDPERVAVIVVGDRSAIEASVRALDLGPVEVLSVDDVLGPADE